jgi:hypothetical protein
MPEAPKRLLKGLIARLGYQVVKSDGPMVRFNAFSSLCASYEHLYNDVTGREAIPPDPRRIALLGRLLGTSPAEAYAIVEALASTRSIDGDVCEFGVAQGDTSALIAHEIRNQARVLHLYDSFEGLPEPTAADELKDDIYGLGSMERYAGEMSAPIDMVVARMRAVGLPPNRYVLHKGFIETLRDDPSLVPSRVSFAYVDFDFYEPIKIALDLLHERASPGAIVIVDDYDFFSTGAKKAVDEFVARHPAVYALEVADLSRGHFATLMKRSE